MADFPSWLLSLVNAVGVHEGRGRRPGIVPVRVPPPPPPPISPKPAGRIVAYVHQAADDKVTVFDPAEIWIVREGADG